MADPGAALAAVHADAVAGRAERPSVTAFVADSATEAILLEGLSEVLPRGIDVRRMPCRQAIALLRRMPTPRVLIIDVSGEDQPIAVLVDLSQVVEPDVRVLVIGDRQDVNFYREITRGLGVLEYLYKPLARSMVARHFGRWINDGAVANEAAQGGRVISFTGTAGGVGATTIATNLAWHLATEVRRHTLLLDSNLFTGSMALAFGVRGDTGLRTALELPARVDQLFIERSAQPVTDRLSVLSSEETLSETPDIAPGAAQHLLGIVRRRYNFVLVDVPFQAQALNRDLIELTDQRVVVMDPTLRSMRDALRLLSLINTGPQSRRALLVLNRFGLSGTLTLAQVEDALGLKPDVIIPFLPRVVGQASIAGKHAVTGRGPFRSAILALAQAATFVRMAETQEAEARPAATGWRRLLRPRA
ncbi:AAA family ATPase [Lichenicoccus roseus]|uniref:Pilus assembly protein n=1 Tax=Lichenicoccus roseus TaxID=2683649 RepID=A0A5R9J791_9PROT|nr:AAA family ATPase [Lichenicoccus roseus]TLU72713.1 pilus assembly protein [Lichenicoccus roseus]